jgi:putative NADH-flavin reductase
MKILILGASRGTGLSAVQQALAKGYQVTAVARNTAAIEAGCRQRETCAGQLKIVEGDVLQPASFEREMLGTDVVISSIGVTNTKPTVLYSEGIGNIIHEMNNYKVSRLICISGVGVEVTPGMSFALKLLTRFVVQPFLKNNFADLLRMEDMVKRSQLNWTIVRAPRLKDGEVTEQYRFASNEYLRNPLILRRADLAHFIVNNLENRDIYRSRVEVAS